VQSQEKQIKKLFAYVPICAILVLALVGLRPNQSGDLTVWTMTPSRGSQLLNTQLSELPVLSESGEVEIPTPAIVLIGTDTCSACRYAEKFLASGSYSVVFVHNGLSGKPRSGLLSTFWLPDNRRLRGVPTLLLVSRSGEVVYVEEGWSNDAAFTEALSHRISQYINQEQNQQGDNR
jgi:hypothetical protein